MAARFRVRKAARFSCGRSWHIAIFGCTAIIDRDPGHAGMAGPAVGRTRSRMTPNGHRRLTQANTNPQFWLLGQDVDQPGYTSFGSVQDVG
jgi:hypothetical protein